jgi:PAS domain S-box-containing protein
MIGTNMKAFANRIFTPFNSREEEDNRFTRLLLAEMLAFLLMCLIGMVGIALEGRKINLNGQIIGLIIASLLVNLYMLKRGWVRLAGNWFLASTFLSVTLAILKLGGILAPVTGMYTFLVISSGLLFGRRGVPINVSASSLAILSIYYAQSTGWLPPAEIEPTLLSWFTYTLTITITGVLTQYAFHYTRDTLAKANDALRLSQAIIQSAPVGILIYLADGRCISANPAASQILGRSIERLLQDDFHHLSSWRDSGIYASAQHALESGQPSEPGHAEFNALSGYHLWLKYVFAPFSRAGVTHLLMIFEDESKQHTAEATLRESEQMLRAVINSPTSYVIRTSIHGNFTFWNDRYMQDYGWLHPEGLEGENPLVTIAEHHHERTRQVVAKCMAQPGQVFQVDLDKIRVNQEIRATLWDFVCLPDQHGQPAEMQCCQRQLEMDLATIRNAHLGGTPKRGWCGRLLLGQS